MTGPTGASDVVTVAAGVGPAIVVVHGGLSDESAWDGVAAQLAPRFRVVRIRRRLYRLELPADPVTDYEREVDDVLAVARTLAEPCLLVGHSSGGVVALEAAVRAPEAFARTRPPRTTPSWSISRWVERP